jgi:plasmid stabilization system protein ParE
MTQYVLGTGVAQDLEAIWDYIAQDNVDAADRWMDKLFGAFESLAETHGWVTSAKTLPPFQFFSGRSAPIW